MAVDNFIYQGINRAVSDYAGSRFCEELINLRPVQGGLVPVRDFAVKLADSPYARIFVHHTTDGDKYIAVKRGTGIVNVYQITIANGAATEVDFNPETLTVDPMFYIDSLTTEGVQDVIDHLYFAAAGNIALFSVCAQAADAFYNYAFTWRQGAYHVTEADAPAVSLALSDELSTATENIQKINRDTTKQEIGGIVESGLNAIQENNPDLCLGPVVIAVAFKTTDGNTFWTGNWTVYDPIPKVNTDTQFYVDENTSSWDYNADYNTYGYWDKYDHAYSVIPIESATTGAGLLGIDSITAAGTKVTLTLSMSAGAWDKDTSLIQSAEVYCSKPSLYLKTSEAADGLLIITGQAPAAAMLVPQVAYNDMDLGGQALYLQASIPMASLAESSQTVALTFGGNIQATEDLLDTDAGAVTRYGRLVSYNARFHYWDSVSKTKIGTPSFCIPASANTAQVNVLVKYADDDGTKTVFVGETGTSFPYDKDAYIVIAPSINVKEVITYVKVGSAYHARIYRMTASTSYNYSICTDGPYWTDHQQHANWEALIAAGVTGITNVERDAINVTEQYNPFVFLVEHSYKAPGNVIDVRPQMAGLTDASYGRDPLSVSTERGLYNLTLGSANVLYGAFVPVSNVVAKRGGIPTEMGIFFLGDGALWLIAGRRATLVSDALSEGPHKYVRGCTGYQKISGVDEAYTPSSTVSSSLYDVSDALSQVPFETFANGGQLGYNRFKMEIFVSNSSYSYTYVLSLKTRQWHKLSKRVWQDEPGGILVNTPAGVGTINVLDTTTETTGTVTVHLQSRPFSNGFQYTHVHRIVAMMRAKLSGTAGHVATAALYGSDDLQDWKLLAYAKRTGSTTTSNNVTSDNPLFLSQIRTPSAARSWRYYTVCIGGTVQAGGDFPTDIGPVLVDHEPVIRRIG